MTDFRAYKNWQRERADYLYHYRDLHKRNDLLQKRLDEAHALIAKMQARAMRNGHDMAGHAVLGSISRNKKSWTVSIRISKQKFTKCGFVTREDAVMWLDMVSHEIGFAELYASQCSGKAAMIVRLRDLLANEKREVV